MQEDTAAPRGERERSLSQRWQDRLLDGAIILFALWTLASHATVAAGGTLRTLELGFAVLVVASVGLAFLLRKVWPASVSTERHTANEVQSSPLARPPLARLRLAGVVAGLAAVVGLSQTSNGELLWWWVTVPLVLAAGALLWLEDRQQPIEFRPPAAGGFRDVLPWVLAILAVVLTLVAHRHDTDDSVYINLAVSAVDHPERPILTGDTMHGIDTLPLHLPLYKLHSFEMLWATLAAWSGLPVIACFHFFAASLAAFLFPLASARLFRLLTPRTWPWTLVFFLVVLVAVGEPHRWYGNFAFVRLWQGKSVFLFVALPLIYAGALGFARRPGWRGWLGLVAVQIAALGLSATALTQAPIAVVAAIAAGVRPGRQGLLRLAAGAASSIYLITVGLLIREQAATTIRLVPWKIDLLPGERLEKALAEILGEGELQLFALAALLLAWALTRSVTARRFALAVPLVIWLVVLNPFTEQLTLRYVAGTLYWRTLWMLPLPLLIALVLASPLQLAGRLRFAGRLGALGLLTAFVFLVPGPHGLSEANRVRLLPMPEFKIHPATYGWARRLQADTGPGVHVVAPDRVGIWIPTFHHHAYPLSVSHYLRMQRRHLDPEEWRQRDLMTRYVDGGARGEGGATEVFRHGIERFDVRGVCLRVARNDDVEAAREILAAAGFSRRKWGSDFEVWSR